LFREASANQPPELISSLAEVFDLLRHGGRLISIATLTQDGDIEVNMSARRREVSRRSAR